MLVPCSGICWSPLTKSGSGSPATSSTVAAMSMTWWNWCRSSPRALDPGGPGDDGAVAGPAPVRGDLLGPLVRGAHRVRPSDRVVVVGGWAADAVDVGDEELGCLQCGRAVEDEHLVEAAVDSALGAGAVVPDHQVDQGVVVDLELLEGVEQAADVVIGVLEEPGVDLHLPLQDRLQLLRHVVVGGDLLMPGRELGIGRDHAPAPSAVRTSPHAAHPTRRRTDHGGGPPTPREPGGARAWRPARSR